MTKHHVIISGTGRAGTTFLVQLFTRLGLDTGFKDPFSAVRPVGNAGMDLSLRKPEAPYIVKNPLICHYLDSLVEEGETVIDHALIPVRDLFSAAESRRHVTQLAKEEEGVPGGGLWGTKDPNEQEAVLTLQLYRLIYALAKHDIPTTLLCFPRLVREPEYLYRKLEFMLGQIGYDLFAEAFGEIARPELVHDFTPGNGGSPTRQQDYGKLALRDLNRVQRLLGKSTEEANAKADVLVRSATAFALIELARAIPGAERLS